MRSRVVLAEVLYEAVIKAADNPRTLNDCLLGPVVAIRKGVIGFGSVVLSSLSFSVSFSFSLSLSLSFALRRIMRCMSIACAVLRLPEVGSLLTLATTSGPTGFGRRAILLAPLPCLQCDLCERRMIEASVGTLKEAGKSHFTDLFPTGQIAAVSGETRERAVVVRKRPGRNLMPCRAPKQDGGAELIA
jgi:hypothetical protein